ncbi:monovalent cation:proton antiporter-2 (CPA2) family protein [Ferrimonas lipolytica]|uniref:Potassium transporter n=1 Tax=Ferrimonas lipolytica TaxID=2724191 RepID=A0A6H1UBI7_9GAMM|nr:monovalent cation:proton antiporter-2 (CPA2) family protein [Ferrimonas lipolytica]QIZ76421.1 potassium transporter [Ferrimonas lipolytica]
MTGYLLQAFIYLIAAVIAVPVARRLGLGSVLGYLIAGVIIGPVIGLVGDETIAIQHFAEFGVVMMLFLVGLELEPKMLWGMRHKLIGLGGLQVGLTTAAVTFIAMKLGQRWEVALTIGLLFSLSSTAIVLQTFSEKGLARTDGGKSAFSVLLLQDIAVIPMLAFIPLLAIPELVAAGEALAQSAEHHDELSLVAGLAPWAYVAIIASSIVAVIAAGHYLTRPLMRFVAAAGVRELFTATALMLVIGVAALMSLVGLSPALGTFLAGVVLANSEFRHELESNIGPFKGLLLGLFFITVGAGINFSVLADQFITIVSLTAGLMLLKGGVLFLLAQIFRIKKANGWLFTLSLAQAGEFGFVLLSFGSQNHVLAAPLVETLSLVVALSMFLTPTLFILYDKVILPRYQQTSNDQEADVIDDHGAVIIAGIGRFGQIVNRLLVNNNIPTVVVDHQAEQVELMRQINTKAYFGDATQPELLHTAGIEHAKAFVIAIDNRDEAVELTAYLRHTYPKLTILARAFDRGHSYLLRQAGANVIESETFHSALELGAATMREVGEHPFYVEQQKATYMDVERRSSDMMYQGWSEVDGDRRYDNNYRKLFMELEDNIRKAMQADRQHHLSKSDRAWTPPPKDYADKLDN